jgi:hypothetical protein
MSSHVPNTMTWQRKSGVFSIVASADRHQQTRRAMEAIRSELFSVVRALFTTILIQKKYNRPGVEVDHLRCALMGRNISGRNILLDSRRATPILIPRRTTGYFSSTVAFIAGSMRDKT